MQLERVTSTASTLGEAESGEHTMARHMQSNAYLAAQMARRYEPHIAPTNELVDALCREQPSRWVPYVSSDFGGTRAEVLFLFSDPGPGTDPAVGGSGFLCVNNDDPSADRFSDCLAKAKLPSPAESRTYR